MMRIKFNNVDFNDVIKQENGYTKIYLNKLLVVGNYLDLSTEKNPILRETYSMIKDSGLPFLPYLTAKLIQTGLSYVLTLFFLHNIL
mgnify:CR=1 FL=1